MPKITEKKASLIASQNLFRKIICKFPDQIDFFIMIQRYFLALCFPVLAFGQSKKPENGIPLKEPDSFVLTHVNIQVSPGKIIENGSVTVREGKIVSVDKFSLTSPKDLPVIDGHNGYLVASFIEVESNVGLGEQKNTSARDDFYYWNDAIAPEYTPDNAIKLTEKDIQTLHQMGFDLVVTHVNDRVAQGYGTLLHLGKSKGQFEQTMVSGHYSFHKGTAHDDYPSSLTGTIALLRQVSYDAQWYKQYGTTKNLSLEAFNKQLELPCLFQADEYWDLLRIRAIGTEFNRHFGIIGTGEEYKLGKVLDTLNNTLIIPVNFPAAYDLKDPYLSREIDLEDLRNWELAPTNPAFLMNLEIPFILTGHGHKTPADFWKHIHKALSLGWTVDDAIRSLTITPAEFMGLEKEYGTIEPNKKASFILYSDNPFLYQAKVLSVFSDGEITYYGDNPEADLRGTYSLNIDGAKYWLDLAGTPNDLSGKVYVIQSGNDSLSGAAKNDTITSNASVQRTGNDLTIQFVQTRGELKEHFSLKGEINTRVFIFEGSGTNPEGKWIKWSAIRNKKYSGENTVKQAWSLDTTSIPGLQYLHKETPAKKTKHHTEPVKEEPLVIIENATLWTNEAEGNFEGTVIVQNGKIKQIIKNTGSYVKPNNAIVIDGKGKILTSGIIDEHSHIALSRGVNEGGQAISCEVRMQDVINPDDIDIYRQLSGGVTAAQLLHGSANPIGGQSALIKLKYKHLPQEMLIKNAPKFVKFALGENVKQSNWGPSNRFPHSRMGVEQLFVYAFSEALAYHQAQQEARTTKKGKESATPEPVDLELEALYEIVSGERHITCHSYVQSEINMLMHVADSFGFKINTFTHILEGYKVADLMKKHGVGASTFSDWWAYKFEVKDAIPQNASLMTAMGLVVAINSDDAEMGRRLNQEAAKSIKYGGMTEAEAWKMVTLNPAILLHLDDRMGSIRVGKDADLVLWTTNPLSIQAKVLYTLIDGEIYYDAQAAFNRLDSIAREKARILAKMGDEVKKGEASKPYQKRKKGHYHCNTVGEMESLETNEH